MNLTTFRCAPERPNVMLTARPSGRRHTAKAAAVLLIVSILNSASVFGQQRQYSSMRAAEDTRGSVDRIFDDPLGGIVVNRTVTVLGKDFYQYFSTRWRQTDGTARYTVSIYERPTARFGSEIWVQYRQQRIFHVFLPPARQATRRISEIAVQQVIENISQREVERITIPDPDMGPEEL